MRDRTETVRQWGDKQASCADSQPYTHNKKTSTLIGKRMQESASIPPRAALAEGRSRSAHWLQDPFTVLTGVWESACFWESCLLPLTSPKHQSQAVWDVAGLSFDWGASCWELAEPKTRNLPGRKQTNSTLSSRDFWTYVELGKPQIVAGCLHTCPAWLWRLSAPGRCNTESTFWIMCVAGTVPTPQACFGI